VRVAIFAGVLLHYAIVGVLLAYGAPLERLDAPVEWSMATIDLAGPPPPPTSHEAYRIDISPRYREHARELVSCSTPNPRRIVGDACVYPSEHDRQAMVHDGIQRTFASFKVCASATGTIASVTTLRSTRYDDYDRRLVAAIYQWRFLPYLVDGEALPVCSAVTFVYGIQ
jgi:hypothetical protein